MRKIIKKTLARTIYIFYRLQGARIFYFHSIHPKHEHANTIEVFTGITDARPVCFKLQRNDARHTSRIGGAHRG